jgi:hypothetical protein
LFAVTGVGRQRLPKQRHRTEELDHYYKRALGLFGASRDGCPEALFLAHGFTPS